MKPRPHVTATHKLLTRSWTADVIAVETAIDHLDADGEATDDCHVVLFEIARDAQLHVNVTHKHPTRNVRGWSGPARLPDGFVHNRRFRDTSSAQISVRIREMILAPRI